MMLAAAAARRSVTSALGRGRAASFSTVVPRVPERRLNEGGPGGRASNADVKVAVFGASGFLGRYVCCCLGDNGVMAYIGNRGDEFSLSYIKVMFDLGRTKFVYYSSRDVDSMKDVIGDADVVINMIGRYYETKKPVNTNSFPYIKLETNFTFQETNVEIPRTIAELCKEMQIDNLIHLSCAGANPDSPSEWARTKYEGEMAVRKAYPWATIVRPTQIFGPEDRFLNWFANMAARFPVVPLVDGGHALTQPVYMTDVAKTIARIVDEPERFEGKTVDCFGPSDYTYEEIAKFVYDITQQEPRIWNFPKSTAKKFASALQYERYPLITPDQIELWSQDYLPAMTPEQYKAQKGVDKILTMDDFGIEATSLEKVGFNYLHRFRKGGHFGFAEGYQG